MQKIVIFLLLLLLLVAAAVVDGTLTPCQVLSPLATFFKRGNMPSTGAVFVWTFGSGFGNFPAFSVDSPHVRIGTTAAEEAFWESDSTIPTKVASGGGAILSVSASLPLKVLSPICLTSTTALFSYDFLTPRWNNLPRTNYMTTGAASVTVVGSNFVRSSKTRIGGTTSSLSRWNSDSSIIGRVNTDSNGNCGIVVTVVPIRIATQSIAVTIDLTAMNFAANTGRTGSMSVTVLAKNAHMQPSNMGPRVGGTACEASAWQSQSSIPCKSPKGHLRKRSAAITSAVRFAFSTVSLAITFNMPLIAMANRGNMPTTGSMSLTYIGGSNVGGYGVVSPFLVRVGGTAVMASQWQSHSSIRGKVSAGTTQARRMYMTVLGVLQDTATFTSAITYDIILLSSAVFTNFPVTGSQTISLFGRNLGNPNTIKIWMHGSSASASRWVSESSVCGKAPYGLDIQRSVASTSTNDRLSTLTMLFSHGMGASASVRGNVLVTSGMSVTVISNGLYGITDPTPRVRTWFAAEATEWVSSSAVRAKLSETNYYATVLTITLNLKSASTQISIDPARISSQAGCNSPSSGSVSVTILGLGYRPTVAFRIANTACLSTVWTSHSSMRGKVPGSIIRPEIIVVTDIRIHQTSTLAFTFNALSISSLVRNGAQTGSYSLTLFGKVFGNLRDNTRKVMVSRTAALATDWASDSTVVAKGAGGSDPRSVYWLGVGITTPSYSSTITKAITFDAATQSSILWRPLMNRSGAQTITIIGSDLGGYVIRTQDTRVGHSASDATRWQSDSTLRVKSPKSNMVSLKEVVSMRISELVLIHSLSSLISYDGPNPQSTIPTTLTNFPCTGGQFVILIGSDYTPFDASAGFRVGFTAAEKHQWMSDTAIRLRIEPAKITSFGITSTALHVVSMSNLFSIDIGYVSSSSPVNIPTTGSATITICGKGNTEYLGMSTLSARAGMTGAAASQWVSDSSLNLKSGAGATVGDSVCLTEANLAHTLTRSLTYNKAPVIYPIVTNLLLTGARSITLIGMEYRLAARNTPKVRIGTTAAGATGWISVTSVAAKGTYSVEGIRNVAVFTGGAALVTTNTLAMTVDNPLVSSSVPTNAPSSGAISFTVLGQSNGIKRFGSRLGKSSAYVQTWVSDSSLQLKIDLGYLRKRSITSTSSYQRNTLTMVFSYNSRIVSSSSATNAASGGGSSLTLVGINMGALSDPSITTRVGGTATMTTRWTSATILSCRIASGVQRARAIAATFLDEDLITVTSQFTFGAPCLLSAASSTTTNFPTTGAKSVTVYGLGFGTSNWSMFSRISKTASGDTRWTSESSAKLKAGSAGAPLETGVAVTQSMFVGTITAAFSSDFAVVTGVSPTNGPIAGGQGSTITGSDMHPVDTTPGARIGNTACVSTSWTSESSVFCRSGAWTTSDASMYGHAMALTVIRASRAKTLTLGYSYSDQMIQGSSWTVAGQAVVDKYGYNLLPHTNLKCWLRSDSFSNTVLDGGSVSSWTDSSASTSGGCAFSQATPANQPVLKRNVLNGNPIVRFSSAASSYLQNTAATFASYFGNGALLHTQLPYTAFFVMRLSSTATATAIPYPVVFSVAGTNSISFEIKDAGVGQNIMSYRLDFSAGVTADSSFGYSARTFHVLAVQQTLSSCVMYVDGTQVKGVVTTAGQATPPAAAVGNNPTIYLGRGPAGAVGPFDGDMAEVAIYNAILTNAEIDRVGNYLAKKFGLNWQWYAPSGGHRQSATTPPSVKIVSSPAMGSAMLYISGPTLAPADTNADTVGGATATASATDLSYLQSTVGVMVSYWVRNCSSPEYAQQCTSYLRREEECSSVGLWQLGQSKSSIGTPATIQCRTPSGIGRDLTVTVYWQGLPFTFDAVFKYDGPTVENVAPSIVPFVGGSLITISGKNFGSALNWTAGYSGSQATFSDLWVPTAPSRIEIITRSTQSCQNITYISDTQLTCIVPRISNIRQEVNLTTKQATGYVVVDTAGQQSHLLSDGSAMTFSGMPSYFSCENSGVTYSDCFDCCHIQCSRDKYQYGVYPATFGYGYSNCTGDCALYCGRAPPYYDDEDTLFNVTALCPVGYYGVRGMTPCTPCPLNTYTVSGSSVTCLACPAGTVTSTTGSYGVSSCIARSVFTYTGGDQTFTVPSWISTVTVLVWGAGGSSGSGIYNAKGGSGGFVQAMLAVTPGETLTVVVGGAGAINAAGSYGGGGGSVANPAGGGGGLSGIFRGAFSFGNAVVVAGGGGGAGTAASYNSGNGGAGGGLTGADGGVYQDATPGRGGTQTTGGTGGTGTGTSNPGSTLQGGACGSCPASPMGAGGGGYLGGGSGNYCSTCAPLGASGGGGGSNYVGGTGVLTFKNEQGAWEVPPETSSPDYVAAVGQGGTAGGTGGNGLVVIRYSAL